MNEDKKQLRAEFVALFTAVAAQLRALGEGAVKFEDTTRDDDFRQSGRLVHPEFALDLYSYNDGYSASAKRRVTVSGSWPRPKDGAYKRLRDYGIGDYNASDPEISVAITGTAERIAKDIRRRLIQGEDIRGKTKAVIARQVEANAYADRKRTLTLDLFKLVGQKPRDGEFERDGTPTVRLYDFAPGVSYGDVRVNGDDSVKFDVTVSGAVAKRLLETLVALK